MREGTGKREANRERRRAAILSIAYQSFLDNGYAGASMSAIADALGGSKTTLWSYFASKDELFNAVVAKLVDEFQEDLRDVLAVEHFSVAAFRNLIVRLTQRLLQPQSICLSRLIIAESGRFPEVGEVFYRCGVLTLRSSIQRFLQSGFDPRRSEDLAEITLAAINGYRNNRIYKASGVGDPDIERFADSLIRNLRLEPDI